MRGNRALSDVYEPGSTSKVMTMAAIVDQLPEKARVARTPSAEELASTYPSGRVPEVDADETAAG